MSAAVFVKLQVCLRLVILFTEEILLQPSAHWWSPDSTLICYAVFNDTDVPHVKFPYYGPSSDMYGHVVDIAYPKVLHQTGPT